VEVERPEGPAPLLLLLIGSCLAKHLLYHCPTNPNNFNETTEELPHPSESWKRDAHIVPSCIVLP
jgi:hypothetical protein